MRPCSNILKQLARLQAFSVWHGLIPKTILQDRKSQKKTSLVSACVRIVSSHTGTIRFGLASSSNLKLDQLMILQLQNRYWRAVRSANRGVARLEPASLCCVLW